MGEKLLAAEPPARHGRADHKLVGGLPLRARIAQEHAAVAVVLLIDAVSLQQLGGFRAEVVGRLGQLGRDLAAQVVALLLDRFDRLREAMRSMCADLDILFSRAASRGPGPRSADFGNVDFRPRFSVNELEADGQDGAGEDFALCEARLSDKHKLTAIVPV